MPRTAEDRALNVRIMKNNIQLDPIGRQLTAEAQDRAANFAADVWKGQMGNGEASQIGIRHVTEGTLK